jgi:penicillin-binding protein 2
MVRERLPSAFIYGLFAVLAAELLYMQVLRFGYYSRLSKNNAIRIIPIDGPRGKMIDRNGTIVVTDRISFDAVVVYHELKDKVSLARLLSEVAGITASDAAKAVEKAAARPYAPVAVLTDIGKEKAIRLEEESFDTSALSIETRSVRNYAYGDTGAHLFGYLTEISEEELEDLRGYGYRMRDLVGRAGLERYYDTYLRGANGGVQIEVDSRGRQKRVLALKEPESGKDIYLAIDIELQKLCDKLLGGRAGAIIVMEPSSGEVLALASHPAFDPNIFVKPRTSAERTRLLRDNRGKPLLNRAISGLYPPGSVFKIVTAAASLDPGRITYYTRFFCGGSFQLGRATFDCWKEGGHGSQNITEALMNSCNVFFYNAGKAAGVDNIETFAKVFGFGRRTGIDLPDEAAGLVPGRLWKRLHRRDNWYEGETVNYAIGQGYLMVAPIQVLEMTAAMANNGSVARPHIVRRIDTTNVALGGRRSLGLKDDTIKRIREGMYKVVNGEGGTGRRARIEGAAVAGKTGTAQNPQGRTHAWFTGFAPYENPKLCLVVFLEHGGKGGVEPSGMAKTIFEEAGRRGYL